MPIYTKKGDRGQTGLFDGTRVSKSDALIEAIGSVDELNATLGNLRVKREEGRKIELIQNDLFAIGSELAGHKTKLDLEKRVSEMEAEIDQMWKEMPPLKNFILPRGQIQVARAVCRRCERSVVAYVSTMNHEPSSTMNFVMKYLNRLGDYLFALARYTNFRDKVKESVWKQN